MGCTVFYRSREEGIIFTEDLLWLCQTHPTSHLSVIRHTPHIYYALGMVAGAGEAFVNKINQISAFRELLGKGKKTKKLLNYIVY